MGVSYNRLTTEQRNPRSTALDRLSPRELVELMVEEDRRLPDAVAAAADGLATLIDVAADRLARGGRLIYVGAGTSGRLGALDAAECPPTFGADPEQVQALLAGGPAALTAAVEGAEDSREAGAKDVRTRHIGPMDLVLGITASGVTPYVLGAVEAAHGAGAATAMLVCSPEADLPGWLDVVLRVVPGPEVLTGSTRLKAGTVTKMVLNILSTGVMVRLGKTYTNLMVDVQPSNCKLVDRSRRILQELTGLSAEEAEVRLAETGDLKTALVMTLAGVESETARQRLAVAGGRVREAVEGRS